jgi:hypothetical protein
MIRKIIFISPYELRKTLVFQYGTYTVMLLSCLQYIYVLYPDQRPLL